MTTLRRHWLRAYPTVVSIWLCLANRAIALDTGSPQPSFEAPRSELVEAVLRDQPLGYFSAGAQSAWQEVDRAASEEMQLEILLDDDVAWSGELLHVRVDPRLAVKQLYVTLPEVSKKRVQLSLNRKSGLYEGRILVPYSYPREVLTVRVVAQDKASKTFERDLILPVMFDGC
jgi:hypothetical protein